MVLVGTKLKVIDNSGAREVKCLKILGGSNLKRGVVGDEVIVSVLKVNPAKKIRKGEVLRGVIVCSKKGLMRPNGFYVSFGINGVVLVNNKKLPIGTRVLGPVMLELRAKALLKILSLAIVAI